MIDGVIQSISAPVEVDRDLPERHEVELSFAILFGLVVNELVSRALRDRAGLEPGKRRRLSVSLEIDQEMVLRVSGADRAATPDSSASILIVEALAVQLDGRLTFHPEGVTVFRLPHP